MPGEPRRLRSRRRSRAVRRRARGLSALLLAVSLGVVSVPVLTGGPAADAHEQTHVDVVDQGARVDRAARALQTGNLQQPAEATAIGQPVQAERPEQIYESEPTNQATVELVVAPEDPSIAPGVGQLRLRVLIRSLGDTEVPAGTLSISIEQGALGDPIEPGADSPVTAETQGQMVTIAQEEVSATGAGEEQVVSVNVPVSELPLTAQTAAPGVYAIFAELHTVAESVEASEEGNGNPSENSSSDGAADDDTSDDNASDDNASNDVETPGSQANDTDGSADDTQVAVTTAQTTIVWRGSQFESNLPLSTIVPFVLPHAIETMPTRDELSEAAPRLNDLYLAAERGDATLAIDPRIIAAIRAYGDNAPAAAADLLARFENTSLTNFLLQFADADPAIQAALGAETLLQPEAIDFLVDPDVPLNAGSTTGSSTTPSPLSITELTKWAGDVSAAWPSEGNTDTATLKLLKASDITTVLLDSRNASVRGGVSFTLEEPGGMTAIVTDAALSDATRAALGAETEVERDAARATIAAALADAAELGSPGIVLAFDRSAVAESEDPAALVNWVNSLDWVDATALDAQAAGAGNLISSFNDDDRLEPLTEAWSRSAQVVELAPLLQHPEYLPQYQDLRMLWIFGTGFARDEAAFADAIARQIEADELHLRGVEVVSAVNTQLVGTSTQVPLQLHNSLPFDAEVLVHVAPSSAAITVTERLFGPTEVVAGGNSTLLVPVKTRVSSGESGLIVHVADAADTRTFVSTTVPLTLQTTLQTILLAGLGAFAALLLGLGIFRSMRRRKKRLLKSSQSEVHQEDGITQP